MKNLKQIIRKYRKSNSIGQGIISLNYKNRVISIPVFPYQNLIERLQNRLNLISNETLDLIENKRAENQIKKLGCICEVRRHPVNPAKWHISVKEYMFYGEKITNVSSYPSRNKGYIKLVYGSLTELAEDLKKIS